MQQETAPFTVHIADWRLDRTAIQSIREQIFIHEQGIPIGLEWDGRDASAVHLLVENSDNQAIATARMLPDGHIGRIAVLEPWRFKGVGSIMVMAFIEIAYQQQLQSVFLNAQQTVIEFYRKNGFKTEGDIYEEAGIPHQNMRRTLDPDTAPETAYMGRQQEEPDETLSRITAGILGESREEIPLECKRDFHNACNALARQARKMVCIFTHDLDGDIYDNQELLESLKRLAIAAKEPSIFILLQNNERVQREGHRLLDLAGRLPSRISIFRPTVDEYLEHTENFMLVDDTAFVYRKWYTRFEGHVSFNNRNRARELTNFFQDAWNESEEDVALRKLGI